MVNARSANGNRVGLGVLLAVCFLLPGLANARVVSLWPDDLKPVESDSAFKQSVEAVGGTVQGSCSFYAAVDLPVGYTVTKLQYIHQGFINASTSVTLYRVKMGQQESFMANASSYDSSANVIVVDHSVGIVNPVVQSGYRYFVRVLVENQNSTVRGVKIYLAR